MDYFTVKFQVKLQLEILLIFKNPIFTYICITDTG